MHYDSPTIISNYSKFNFSFHMGPLTIPLTVIAGLTRNLPCERVSSSRLGDGGCFSAMTVKALGLCCPV